MGCPYACAQHCSSQLNRKRHTRPLDERSKLVYRRGPIERIPAVPPQPLPALEPGVTLQSRLPLLLENRRLVLATESEVAATAEGDNSHCLRKELLRELNSYGAAVEGKREPSRCQGRCSGVALHYGQRTCYAGV